MTQTRGPESFRKSVSIYLRSASATTTTQASICNTVDTVKITAAGILCVGRTAKAMQARQEDTHTQRSSFSSFCFKLSLFACVFLRPNFPCALLVRTSYTSLGEQSLCLAPRRWGRFVPFVLAKRPQRREARRSGCFRRLVVHSW